jgi:hypothetical protein
MTPLFRPGDAVQWLRVRDQRTDVQTVHDAWVVRVTPTRVVIRLKRWDGVWVTKTVRPESLRRR